MLWRSGQYPLEKWRIIMVAAVEEVGWIRRTGLVCAVVVAEQNVEGTAEVIVVNDGDTDGSAAM
jgi:hypothetical protein